MQTRWSFRNAHCLCVFCHTHFTDNPIEFDEWVDTTWLAKYRESEQEKNSLKIPIPIKVDIQKRIDVCREIVQGQLTLYEAQRDDL